MDKSDLFMEISDILPLKKRRFFNFFAPFLQFLKFYTNVLRHLKAAFYSIDKVRYVIAGSRRAG